MSRPGTARIATAAAASALLTVTIGLSPAEAHDAAPECLEAGNVWVVVEHDSASASGCATEFSTGLKALTSAGIDYTEAGGFVATVDGQPAEAGPEDWWSYWSGAVAEGDAITWTSYLVGAAESEPKAGTVEGWRLAHSFTEEAPAPSLTSLPGLPGAGV